MSDQGEGFVQPSFCACPCTDSLPDNPLVSDCGRGLYILHQVLDQVRWSENGKEVHLAKQLMPLSIVSLISPGSFLKMIEAWWRRWWPAYVRSV